MLEAIVFTIAMTVPTDGLSKTERVAASTKGFATSLYKGKWYHKKWEDERECIMWRESRFNYKAANKSSSARGAYQFLDNNWRDGLVWMMLEEGGNKKEIKALRNKPIHKWNRYYQDRAFYTAWRNGEGAKHWHLQESRCNL